MTKLLVLVHTVSPLLAVFDHLATQLLPGVQLVHQLDSMILEGVRRRGELAAEDAEHLLAHVRWAEQLEADAVLVTCSTISPCVDLIRSKTALPLLKIDEAMIAQAVKLGGKVGLVATNATTLGPSEALLMAEAARQGHSLVVEKQLVPQALPALLAGDGPRHDQLVREAILDIVDRVEVVVLAQASMARALPDPTAVDTPVPVLSSPHLALAAIKEMFVAGSPAERVGVQ